MLVDEQFRKCVTFLYEEVTTAGKSASKRPVGSAFFVGLPVTEVPGKRDQRWSYVVTARHVIDRPGDLSLRLRLKDGTFVDQPIPRGAWAHHPHTDVAVTLFPASKVDSDLAHLAPDQFATEEFVQQNEVGEGDDVFFSGLFVAHPGQGVPQPIVRFGNVALMPREPVRVEISRNPRTFAAIEAYLTEARSWGGQSGSPAFLSLSPDRHSQSGRLVVGGTSFALLGLVQGIWKDPEGARAPDPSGEGVIEVNMGISIVVPAYKILELLMSEPLAKSRADLVAHLGPA